jgi:hypothetical protein
MTFFFKGLKPEKSGSERRRPDYFFQKKIYYEVDGTLLQNMSRRTLIAALAILLICAAVHANSTQGTPQKPQNTSQLSLTIDLVPPQICN